MSRGSEYGTIVDARATQSSKYLRIRLNMPLNMGEYALTSLNISEHG